MKRQLVNVMTYPSKRGQKLLISEKFQREDNGEICKRIIEVKNPSVSFYVTKPEFKLSTNINFIETEKVDKVTVPYKDFIPTLFELSGRTQEEYNEIKNNNYQALRNIHINKNFHQTDLYYDDFTIREYLNRFSEEIYPFNLDKSYTDIETDISSYYSFPDPNIAPCPICLLSYIYAPTKTIYGFILRDTTNKSQTNFLKNVLSDEWKEKVIAEYLTDSKPENTANELIILVFDTELELLTEYFKILHHDKPDFNGG